MEFSTLVVYFAIYNQRVTFNGRRMNMKKAFATVVMLVLLLSFVSCGSSGGVDLAPGSLELDMELNGAYQLDENFLSDCSFVKPAGVLFHDGRLFVADSGNNCIQVFDADGKHIDTIGSTGNGQLQFLDPTAITYYSDMYYVLDAKNERIEILNKDFSYNSERKLSEVPAEDPYIDIAVDQAGDAYVTTMYGVHKYAHVYKVDDADLITQMGEKLIGYVAQGDDGVYMANTMEVLNDAARTGANSLYQVSGNELNLASELPYKYMPYDFIIDGGDVFMYGATRNTLDRFSVDGMYQETLYQFDGTAGIQYICSDDDHTTFYLSSPKEGKVYRLERK